MSLAPGFDIRSNVREFQRGLSDVERAQLPFATFLAVNDVAEAAVRHNQRAMRRQIDRPKPFTLRGIYPRKGRYRRGRRRQGMGEAIANASVMFREFAGKGVPASKYLKSIVHGTPRRAKRHEIALRRRGFLGRSDFLVPAPGQRLNQYGNLTGARYTKILSALGAFQENGYVANRTAASAARNTRSKPMFYAKKGGNLHPGVYERARSGRIKPVLIEVKQPQYERRYDFFRITEAFVRRQLPISLQIMMRRAVRTAR